MTMYNAKIMGRPELMQAFYHVRLFFVLLGCRECSRRYESFVVMPSLFASSFL
ncbi:hypothetical protein Syun_006960 [Stephania yunnanensis]|uniref:Uncharacterized protein n=1 Tax=Stephania yunnanensis TaxID=152371 RepID=A0AAP0L112_9MAGN